MTDTWFSVDTGCGQRKCFTKQDVQNFGFEDWKKQVPKCAGGNAKGNCSTCCQVCTQSVGCSGQQCPYLARDRSFYNLGPLKGIKVGGSCTKQPYTFPLPLDYGKWPPINTNLITWARVP